MFPPRVPWQAFPDVLLHAAESFVKQHVDYKAAKSGDADAACRLVLDALDDQRIERLLRLVAGSKPILLSAHAFEATGVNAIPEALADVLAKRLGWPADDGIVQTNVVAHTGAGGFDRLARQARFSGTVLEGACYVLVDDFIGQGGTLANLRGHVHAGGGRVVAATALTGKPYSARLALSDTQLQNLRNCHGPELEQWWSERFGHAFDCLTESEARYLARSADADRIRDRIVAAQQERDSGTAA